MKHQMTCHPSASATTMPDELPTDMYASPAVDATGMPLAPNPVAEGDREAGESNGNAATQSRRGNSKKREGKALYLTQGMAPWLLDPASPRYDMGEPDGDLMVEEVIPQMSEWLDTPRNLSWRAGQYYTADLM